MKVAVIDAVVVGAGGFLGAIARHLLGAVVQRLVAPVQYPVGTLVVNLLGCLAIGMVAGWLESKAPVGMEWRRFVVVGLLGGFTTFSAFAHDTVSMVRAEALGPAVLNVTAQVALGLACVWLGHTLMTPR